MSTSIPPEFESYLTEAVSAGRYASPEDAVREAFHLLQERDRRHEALHRDVKEGFDQLERGEYIELDEEGLRSLGEEIKRRGRERYEAAKKAP